MVGRAGCRDGRGGCGEARRRDGTVVARPPGWGRCGERLLAWAPVPFLATRHAVRCIANLDALHARPRSSSAVDARCVPGFGPLLLAPSHRGLVRIRSASAVGALGPHHLGGVLLVENLVAVAAFKCLLDHGGLLFRRGMRFGRAAVRASCPLHGKARPVFLENAKSLMDECRANSAAELIGGLPTARWLGCLAGLRRLGSQAAKRPQQSSTLLSRIGLGLLNNQRRRGRGIH